MEPWRGSEGREGWKDGGGGQSLILTFDPLFSTRSSATPHPCIARQKWWTCIATG